MGCIMSLFEELKKSLEQAIEHEKNNTLTDTFDSYIDEDGNKLKIFYLTIEQIRNDYVNRNFSQLSRISYEEGYDGFTIRVKE